MLILRRAVICLLISAITIAAHASNTIEVPRGSAITLDGRLSDDEWAAAARQELVGGGEVRFKHDGAHLFIGVRGANRGWSHIYVPDGESIHVLHASAALGTAIYRRSGDAWQPVQSFQWAMRDRSMSEQAMAARESFLKSTGWVASTNGMGAGNEIEFKISRSFLKGASPRIAVLYASDPKSPAYWPGSLTDDCLKEKLIFGTTPNDLKFNTSVWATIEFK